MVSLGCAKNLVDAEIMLGSVRAGMEITAEAEEADVLVVNTCAFIDSAKEESIEAILEAHQKRGLAKAADQKLIVSGCMSQRFAKELRRSCRRWTPSSAWTRCANSARSSSASLGQARGPVGSLESGHRGRLHSRLGHAAFPAHAGTHRLREDCGGLQSSVQLLRDPADAWPTSQPTAGIVVAEVRGSSRKA